MVIGITGPTGSGKSTVSAFLIKEYDMYLIDADKVARTVTEKGTKCLDELVSSFGEKFLDSDGSLNRKKLGSFVFSDREALAKLNLITHKYILCEIKRLTEKNENCIIDAPLLFETGLELMCHKIILVTCNENIRTERIMLRDSLSYEDAKNRILSQNDYSLYATKCDLIVDTSGKESIEFQLREVKAWQRK